MSPKLPALSSDSSAQSSVTTAETQNRDRTLVNTRVIIAGVLVVLAGLAFVFVDVGRNWQFVMELRSRKLAGMILVGWATGVATVAFQTVTHNRLLTPSIMGLDALFAFIQTGLILVLGMTFASRVGIYPMFALNLGLMMLATMGLVALLFQGKQRSVFILVLAGLVLGTVLRSATALLQRILDPTAFLVLQTHLFATFGTINPELLGVSAILIALSTWLIFHHIPDLDVISLGRQTAISLGVPYDQVVRRMILTGTLMVCVSTALVGPITFLGLIVAAIAHEVGGSGRHRVVLPMAGLLGVLLLVGGQAILERALGMATVLSVIIEFVGGIVFIWLVVRKVSHT